MDLPGLTVTPVARDGEPRFRALMDGRHHHPLPLLETFVDPDRLHGTAAARQRPGACRIRNIMTGVDPDRPARATARFRREHGRDRGAGIAVDGRTARGAVDGAGRQTHVPGASTHGASAPHDFIEEMRLRSKQVRTRELKDTPQSVER